MLAGPRLCNMCTQHYSIFSYQYDQISLLIRTVYSGKTVTQWAAVRIPYGRVCLFCVRSVLPIKSRLKFFIHIFSVWNAYTRIFNVRNVLMRMLYLVIELIIHVDGVLIIIMHAYWVLVRLIYWGLYIAFEVYIRV